MLVFYTPDNRANKRDGDEFKREASLFCALQDDAEPVPLRGTRTERFATFSAACADRAGQDLDAVVFFMHGVKRGLPHLCTAKMVPDFAASLALCIDDCAHLVFNSCLCAQDFTQALVDELDRVGVSGASAWGHLTAGHTTRNPHAASSTALGGTSRIVAPKTPLWRKWIQWLKVGDNRFRAPFMDTYDIHRALGSKEPGPLPMDWREPEEIKNQW
ncbi:MAG: hypothetical protein GY851_09435 [bacterium]|nr:hypothetical protein [bacterium]